MEHEQNQDQEKNYEKRMVTAQRALNLIQKNLDDQRPINPIILQTEAGLVMNNGLSRREYFAGLAMKGMLSNSHTTRTANEAIIAGAAILYADALCAELDKKPEGKEK